MIKNEKKTIRERIQKAKAIVKPVEGSKRLKKFNCLGYFIVYIKVFLVERFTIFLAETFTEKLFVCVDHLLLSSL